MDSIGINFVVFSSFRAAIKVAKHALLGQPSLDINKPKDDPVVKKVDSAVSTKTDSIVNTEDTQKQDTAAAREQEKEDVKKQLFGEESMDADDQADAVKSHSEDVIVADSKEEDAEPNTESMMDTNENSNDLCKVVIDTSKSLRERMLNSETTDEAALIQILKPAEINCKKEIIEPKSSPVRKEDSGYITHLPSEEENSADQPSNDKDENTETAETREQDKSEVHDSSFTSVKSWSGKVIPALGSVVAPRLSGGPNDFVDLEDGEAGGKEAEKKGPAPGITQLMNRLMKHSTKKQKQKAKEVTVR